MVHRYWPEAFPEIISLGNHTSQACLAGAFMGHGSSDVLPSLDPRANEKP